MSLSITAGNAGPRYTLGVMIHEILPVGLLRCNCSILGDEITREAIVVDPGDNIEDIQRILEKHGLKATAIVVTHAHIDHVAGAQKLKELTGAPVYLNSNDAALLSALDQQAKIVLERKAGQQLAAAGLGLKARDPENNKFDGIGVVGRDLEEKLLGGHQLPLPDRVRRERHLPGQRLDDVQLVPRHDAIICRTQVIGQEPIGRLIALHRIPGRHVAVF